MAMHEKDYAPFSKTRFAGLGYKKICDNCWMVLDLHDAPARVSQVGPQYRTKTELLADLENYAKGWGY